MLRFAALRLVRPGRPARPSRSALVRRRFALFPRSGPDPVLPLAPLARLRMRVVRGAGPGCSAPWVVARSASRARRAERWSFWFSQGLAQNDNAI